MPDASAYRLDEGQALFLGTLQNGPAHCPDDLFSTSASRTINGLKAHANTISHARLVALEDTYPRTMQRLDRLFGAGYFNTVCRDFIERGAVRARAMMHIGADFGAYLAERSHDPASSDLVQIEYAWLESYHAADAEPLRIAHIAGLSEPALLALPLAVHPSVRRIMLHAPLAEELPELAHSTEAAIITVRPEADVLFHPWSREQAHIFAALQMADAKNADMGNLLAQAAEYVGEDKVQPLVLSFLNAGVFRRPV